MPWDARRRMASAWLRANRPVERIHEHERIDPDVKRCPDCDRPIKPSSTRCKPCSNAARRAALRHPCADCGKSCASESVRCRPCEDKRRKGAAVQSGEAA